MRGWDFFFEVSHDGHIGGKMAIYIEQGCIQRGGGGGAHWDFPTPA